MKKSLLAGLLASSFACASTPPPSAPAPQEQPSAAGVQVANTRVSAARRLSDRAWTRNSSLGAQKNGFVVQRRDSNSGRVYLRRIAPEVYYGGSGSERAVLDAPATRETYRSEGMRRYVNEMVSRVDEEQSSQASAARRLSEGPPATASTRQGAQNLVLSAATESTPRVVHDTVWVSKVVKEYVENSPEIPEGQLVIRFGDAIYYLEGRYVCSTEPVRGCIDVERVKRRKPL